MEPGQPPRREPLIPAGEGKRWTQIWEMTDEFWYHDENGVPALRPIWEPFNKNWSGRRPAFFKTENVVATPTSLQLWSREDTVRGQPNAAYLRSSGYRDFSTAFVRTHHRQLYGYFEIFCRLMDSRVSSAFWFAHNEPPGEDSWWTEVDVFEFSTSSARGVEQRSRVNTNWHVHRNGRQPHWDHLDSPVEMDVGFDLSERAHKWALDWTEDYVTWYLDDRPIRTEVNRYLKRPMHLQFDSETFPRWFGLPETGGSEKNNLPNKFEIYYVRSWARESQEVCH